MRCLVFEYGLIDKQAVQVSWWKRIRVAQMSSYILDIWSLIEVELPLFDALYI